MIVALFGFLGIIIGASLQFWFNYRSNLKTRYLELRSTAYADYINAVARVPTSLEENRSKLLREVTSAKARICVFGDADVVESLLSLEKTSRILSNRDARNAFKSLLSVMRSKGVAVGEVDESAFEVILLGESN